MVYRNLKLWIKANEVVKDIIHLLNELPQENSLVITSEMSKTAVSISSNLAEAISIMDSKEQLKFIEVANISLMDVAKKLDYLFELKYIDYKTYVNKKEKIEKLNGDICGYIMQYNSLKSVTQTLESMKDIKI